MPIGIRHLLQPALRGKGQEQTQLVLPGRLRTQTLQTGQIVVIHGQQPVEPLEIRDVTKIITTGRPEAKAALMAKLTVARASDVAKAALLEAESIEGEIVVEK